MKLSFTTLDVFTKTRYTGNPLAIISIPSTLSHPLTQAQKQSIASEFNLSEIVFLFLPSPTLTPSTTIKIEIFTSLAEVPFAGHPTIGTAFYLLNTLSQTTNHITHILTKAGPIPIFNNENTNEVEASIPFNFHIHAKTYYSPLTRANHPVASIVKGMSFIYVPLPSLSALSSATENLNVREFGTTYNASALDEDWKEGLVGTMYYVPMGEDEFGRKKYRTRMWGSREDPGTGSASSGLACLLAMTEGKGGGNGFVFEQGVEMGRRNEIVVLLQRGEEGIERVGLSGGAVVVMDGTLEV